MEIEIRFNNNNIALKEYLINSCGLSESDFWEIRPLDGTAILCAVFLAIETLVKNPEIVKILFDHNDCEVTFDENGQLLRAKGYSAKEVIELYAVTYNTQSDKSDG